MQPQEPYEDPLRNVRTLLVSMVSILIVGTGWMLFFNTEEAAIEGPGTVATVVEAASTTSSSAVSEGTTASTVEATVATAAVTTATNALGERIVTIPDEPLQGLEVVELASGLSQLTMVATAPGDDRIFVTERVGRIKVIDNGVVQEESWMNITDKVLANGIEQGLLGLTFHPDYAQNGRFFAYFTNKDAKRTLAEFSGNFIEGDGSSIKILFSLSQPPDSVDIRHYGGMVQFGPDGLLYVSLGDGAASRQEGQNSDSFYGTILRLDVDNGDPYIVPADNPFVSGGGAPEVFAYGLRNPWRFWIDPYDKNIYIADVGQGNWEEIDVISSVGGGGYNLGWSNMEGTHCFHESGCDINDYEAPVLEYPHSDGNCSVTGGPVYRGAAIPEVDGHYFYTDWCAGWIRSFLYKDGARTTEADWESDLGAVKNINAIGTDSNGEMIIVTHGGRVLRIVPVR